MIGASHHRSAQQWFALVGIALAAALIAKFASLFLVLWQHDVSEKRIWAILLPRRNYLISDAASILLRLGVGWLPSFALYYAAKGGLNLGSTWGKITALAFAITTPTLLLFAFIAAYSNESSHAEWAGHVMLDKGRPTAFQIDLVTWELLFMWLLSSVFVVGKGQSFKDRAGS